MLTIKQLLTKNISVDKQDAELLLAHVIGKPREFLIAHPEYNVSKLASWQVGKLIKKRSQGVPLAYLIHHKEFFGLDFDVNKHTLIPRPDTETLVESVLSHITHHIPRINSLTLIDVGTGSGCIPITILKNLPTCQLANLQTFATDISKPALRVARRNAQKHNANITFLHGNLLEPVRNCSLFTDHCSLILTANLPYLDESWYDESPSIHHEPKSALVAEKKGTALYEELFKQVTTSLATHPATLFLEIDPRHAIDMKTLAEKYFPDGKISITKDLAGHDRVLAIDNKNHT